MGQSTGIERAVGMFEGSASKLAAAVGRGVKRQHVEHWLKAGRVSPEKCAEVAEVAGVPCEDLNEKVNWALAAQLAARKVSANA